MRRASLTNSLIAPVIGSESPALSVRSATICMSLSAQVKEILSHSLSASEAPELISKAARSLPRSMPVVSASRPASIRPTALIQSSRLFMVLPTWPWPTSPEMSIVGAKAAVDRASALDHVGLAANERQQRSVIGGEAATAGRRIEDGDARRPRVLIERLDGVGLGGRGHRDDRAARESGEQPVPSQHDLIDLVVIADADDHEIGRARDLGRRLGGGGAGIARLGQLFIVDVAGGHLVALFDEMLEHRKPHAPNADDAHALLLSGCHGCHLCGVGLVVLSADAAIPSP